MDVVIPCFNGGAYLARCLESVLAQSTAPSQVIVIDDGSEDRSREIAETYARTYPKVKVLAHENNQGVSAARNTGIAQVSSEFVAFLDADDLWLPEKLETQLELFHSNRDVGLVHSSYNYVDLHGRLLNKSISPPSKRGYIFSDLFFNQYSFSGSASAAVVKRDVLIKAGPFDTNLRLGEDADMWTRLSRICEVDFSPEELVSIRINPHSAQRSRTDKMERRIFEYEQLLYRYNKWWGEIDFEEQLLEELRLRGRKLAKRAHRLAYWRRKRLFERIAANNYPLWDVLFSDQASWMRYVCGTRGPEA